MFETMNGQITQLNLREGLNEQVNSNLLKINDIWIFPTFFLNFRSCFLAISKKDTKQLKLSDEIKIIIFFAYSSWSI